jgi:hypothetical protein
MYAPIVRNASQPKYALEQGLFEDRSLPFLSAKVKWVILSCVRQVMAKLRSGQCGWQSGVSVTYFKTASII